MLMWYDMFSLTDIFMFKTYLEKKIPNHRKFCFCTNTNRSFPGRRSENSRQVSSKRAPRMTFAIKTNGSVSPSPSAAHKGHIRHHYHLTLTHLQPLPHLSSDQHPLPASFLSISVYAALRLPLPGIHFDRRDNLRLEPDGV